MHEKSCMVTLTYDDVHLPHYGQLLKSDLQKFFKRMRHEYGKFRYVACGEYGDQSRRPHFHIAFFGVDFGDDRIHYSYAKSGDHTYRSKRLSSLWSFGNHDIGTLNFESAAYIARYIMKKVKGVGASPLPLAVLDDGELIMPNKEFLVSSKGRVKGQGIGASWFRQYFMTDVFPTGSVITAQGSSAPVPRYYKALLKEVGEDLALEMGHKAYVRADAQIEQTAFENSPRRKFARSEVALSRAKQSKRSI